MGTEVKEAPVLASLSMINAEIMEGTEQSCAATITSFCPAAARHRELWDRRNPGGKGQRSRQKEKAKEGLLGAGR